jgi:hypothetical protein
LSYIIFYRLQTRDVIILKKKIQYLDPVAIYESLHARSRWMKDDDDFLKLFKRCKEKQKQQNEFHKETMKRTAAYISLMMC